MTGILFSLFRQFGAGALGVHPAKLGLREPKARHQTTDLITDFKHPPCPPCDDSSRISNAAPIELSKMALSDE